MAIIRPKNDEFQWKGHQTLLHLPTNTHFTVSNGRVMDYEENKLGTRLRDGNDYWPNDVVAFAGRIARQQQNVS